MVKDILLSDLEPHPRGSTPTSYLSAARSGTTTTTAELNIISTNRANIVKQEPRQLTSTKYSHGKTTATNTTTRCSSDSTCFSTGDSLLATSSSTEMMLQVNPPALTLKPSRRQMKSTLNMTRYAGMKRDKTSLPTTQQPCQDYYSALAFTYDVAKQTYA
ncbi:hypothetical protein EON64_16520 [archaeon]|nr:MAG: hypothetical protein EON64_16520 [archaeon]